MDVLYERCCGLDIHKKLVVACLITPGPKRVPSKEVRSFGTMTHDLLALGDWLRDQGVTHVAMEATGVYWKPLFNLLEERFTLVLANAQHIKQVPGRKTDVRDCEWIADLLRHGLLRASYVPDRPQRELRELTRYRTTLVRERAREVNRIQKTLEGANVKLGDVASDVLGTSGRAMLDAMVNGTTNATALADLARGRLRDKLDRLEQALSGRMGDHQRFLLAEQLRHLDSLDQRIDRVSAEIAERVRPFAALIERLDAIPGVGRRVAEVLVAEVGTDMTRFPSAAHLASWAGICPGNNESAGKRKSGRIRRGNPWVRMALVEAAHAAVRTKDTYLGAQFRRLAARRGAKKASIAVAHSILVIVYHLLQHDCPYADLGSNYFDEHDRQQVARRLVQRLEGLGYRVALDSLTPPASAA
ncbi:MAG: IS110 family transposase [Chloroflexota bacterium]|nr:IS110 family transposase [Chloroflexota bacterium]